MWFIAPDQTVSVAVGDRSYAVVNGLFEVKEEADAKRMVELYAQTLAPEPDPEIVPEPVPEKKAKAK